MNLEKYGYKEYFSQQREAYSEDYILGRVISNHARIYDLATETGMVKAEVSGKFAYTQLGTGGYPAVGDWVLATNAEDNYMIEKVLERSSNFSRKMAGNTTDEQVVAANFDYVFIVNALNKDYNIRKIERYLVVAWESGATPVIILSKQDLCDDVEEKLLEVESIALGVEIHAISSLYEEGLEDLQKYMKPGKTIVVLGSSGVGKSTLVNTLAGKEVLKVNAVREDDDRGRHTTTHRELVLLDNGALILDTPGMRELQLWRGDQGLDNVFAEITELSNQCRFNDCSHTSEPGCAIIQALENGSLSKERFSNYTKLKKEARYIEAKQNQRLRQEAKKIYKQNIGYRNKVKY